MRLEVYKSISADEPAGLGARWMHPPASGRNPPKASKYASRPRRVGSPRIRDPPGSTGARRRESSSRARSQVAKADDDQRQPPLVSVGLSVIRCASLMMSRKESDRVSGSRHAANAVTSPISSSPMPSSAAGRQIMSRSHRLLRLAHDRRIKRRGASDEVCRAGLQQPGGVRSAFTR